MHERDVEYFKEYPAPVMENLQRGHFTNINSTIPFFGPMLYFFARGIGAEQVLEIGHAEGYTAYYLAHAVNDNAVRYGMQGNMYHGIDIVQTERVRDALLSRGLPADVRKLDSMMLKPDTFGETVFDIIFQDGNHDTEHVLYELETMYPRLKGKGCGYWIFHDCFGPAEEGMQAVMSRIRAGEYNFEFVRIFEAYGIAIMRKMDEWDENKRHWTP